MVKEGVAPVGPFRQMSVPKKAKSVPLGYCGRKRSGRRPPCGLSIEAILFIDKEMGLMKDHSDYFSCHCLPAALFQTPMLITRCSNYIYQKGV